jgi:hypothetical protein
LDEIIATNKPFIKAEIAKRQQPINTGLNILLIFKSENTSMLSKEKKKRQK